MGAADSTGLAYLMSLLGGIGEGGYKGYAGGMEDQQKAAQLAERQRQFDLGSFTDISPEQSQALGVPAGRTRNTIIPALLTASEKRAARAEDQAMRQSASQGYSTLAGQYPEINRSGALDTNENPEAAGTPAPSQPNRLLTFFSQAAQGGREKEIMPAFVEWMRGMGVGRPAPGQTPLTGVHFDKAYDAQGNPIDVATPYDRRTGAVGQQQQVQNPVGGSAMGNRSATDQAAKRIEAGGPTPTNIQRFDAVRPTVPISPGAIVEKPSTAVYGGGTQPVPAQAARGGSKLDSVADPGQYVDFSPSAVRGPNGSLYNPPPVDPGMRREYSAGMYSVDALREVARDLRTLAPDEQSRLSLYFRTALQSTTPVSIFQFLSPAEARTRTTLQHIQLRYEQAMGGARMAGSIQMYPVMQRFLGGVEGFITPEITEDLANNMAGYLSTVTGVERSQGMRPLPPPPAKTPTPPVAPPPPPGGFNEWKRRQGGG